MRRLALLSVALLLGLAACSATPKKEIALGPPEAFHWAEQPISFSPPPTSWRREGYNQGGLLGVRFIKTGSVGEGITLAVYYLLSDRDRRAELQELLDRFDSMSDRELRRALELAPSRTDAPFSPLEVQVATAVNQAVSRASLAQIQGDRATAKSEIRDALEKARRLRFTLADAIDSVVFRPERHSEPDRFRVTSRRDTTVSGVEAVMVSYEFQSLERVYQGREYYFRQDNHLFTARYIGLKENLGLFDRVVSTVTFPPRTAAAAP